MILSIVVHKYIYVTAIILSLLLLTYSIGLTANIHPTILNFSESYLGEINPLNVGLEFSIGVDGISMLFIILTTLLNVVCV